MVAALLAVVGLLGIFAGSLGLVANSGETAGALSSGGVIFLILGGLLALAATGMMRLRRWSWWLATVTALAAILWTLARMLQVAGIVHVEWYGTLGLAAIFFGYLMASHTYFRRADLE